MTTRSQFEENKFRTHGILHYEVHASQKTTPHKLQEYQEKRKQLHRLVYTRITMYYLDGGYKSMSSCYIALEKICFIAQSTIKKVTIGAHDITREFLYKFTVGLKMSILEADQYFALCGGPLSGENDYDYIVLNALRDKDTTESLLEEFFAFFQRKL